MKDEFFALLKENKEFAKRVAKTENEYSRLERRSKSFSQSEVVLMILFVTACCYKWGFVLSFFEV